MERPPMRVSGPTFDAADPIALAGFYARLLGWTVVAIEGPGTDQPDAPPWAMVRSPGGRLKIEVQWEPNYRPPVWPSQPGRQLMMAHLDIGVADLAAGVEWAVSCGARVADEQPQAGVRVLLDPEGHPFCLFPDSGA